MDNNKIVICGFGKMSKIIIKYLSELNANIIDVFDHNKKVGLNVGEECNIDNYNISVKNINDLELILKEKKPDVCIVATKSLLKDVYEILYLCASNGVNVLTTCEESFYPQNSSPKLYEKLDKIAKINNCTISGTGYQDVAWGYLITTIAGSLSNIGRITGQSSYNVEEYGKALAEAHGVGLTQDEFNNKLGKQLSEEELQYTIKNGEFIPSYRWNTNGWLASKMGLVVEKQSQYNKPIISNEAFYSSELSMYIKKSDIIGMSSVVNTKTKEGIEIEFECIGKIYKSNEVDNYKIKIYDVNDNEIISITIPEPKTAERTCATIVNRIPDIIEAPSGFITTDKLNAPKYLVKKTK